MYRVKMHLPQPELVTVEFAQALKSARRESLPEVLRSVAVQLAVWREFLEASHQALGLQAAFASQAALPESEFEERAHAEFESVELESLVSQNVAEWEASRHEVPLQASMVPA
jgi:hypothetical protein